MFSKEISKLKFTFLSYFITSAFLSVYFLMLHWLFENAEYVKHVEMPSNSGAIFAPYIMSAVFAIAAPILNLLWHILMHWLMPGKEYLENVKSSYGLPVRDYRFTNFLKYSSYIFMLFLLVSEVRLLYVYGGFSQNNLKLTGMLVLSILLLPMAIHIVNVWFGIFSLGRQNRKKYLEHHGHDKALLASMGESVIPG